MAIDIDQSHYNTGTASVAGTAVTGQGTTWLGAVRPGDLFGTHKGSGVRIASVDSNTSLTLAYPWLGGAQTAAVYEIQRTPFDVGYYQALENLLLLLGGGNLESFAGLSGLDGKIPVFTGPATLDLISKVDLVSGVEFDVQVADIAARDAYNGQSAGFAVLVANTGDGRSAIYSKLSNASGDWSAPAYLTGPVGPLPTVTAGTTTTLAPGTDATVVSTPVTGGASLAFGIPAGEGFVSRGAYSAATAYVKGDVVTSNNSSWIAKVATTGNAPPALPTTSNTQWQLLAAKGTDGTGTGDVVGPASSVNDRIAVFSGTTGKLIKDGGKTLAEVVPGVVPGNGIAVDNTDPTAPIVSNLIFAAPQGRLSLVAATAAPESDATGATSIYYVPCIGGYVPVFDGVGFASRSIGAGLSLALDNNAAHTSYHQAGSIYDLFAFIDGATLRLGTGAAWDAGAIAGSSASGASFRGAGAGSTELESYQGILVNKNSLAIRWGSGSGDLVADVPARQATYLGSFVATANGQATDSKAKRLLFNVYCQLSRPMKLMGGTGYTYTSVAWRQSQGLSTYQIEFLLGLAGVAVSAQNGQALTTTAAVNWAAGIGLNDAITPAADCSIGFGSSVVGAIDGAMATYRGFPGIGRHSLKAMEQGATGITFYSSGMGMYGEFLG